MTKGNAIGLNILIGLIFLSHCSLGQSSPNIEREIQSSYFPNSIGNYWTYKVVDKVNNTIDTLIVKIVKDTVIYGKSYMIWDYRYTVAFPFLGKATISYNLRRFVINYYLLLS